MASLAHQRGWAINTEQALATELLLHSAATERHKREGGRKKERESVRERYSSSLFTAKLKATTSHKSCVNRFLIFGQLA